MKIMKGNHYRCLRTILADDGTALYLEGRTYPSERNDCLTDERHNPWHFVTGTCVADLFAHQPQAPAAADKKVPEASAAPKDSATSDGPSALFYFFVGVFIAIMILLMFPVTVF